MLVLEWMRLTDAAAHLRLPYRTVYDLALRGRLEARRAGAGWEVRVTSVEQLARERAAAEPAADA